MIATAAAGHPSQGLRPIAKVDLHHAHSPWPMAHGPQARGAAVALFELSDSVEPHDSGLAKRQTPVSQT
jgi:hypothetical protein